MGLEYSKYYLEPVRKLNALQERISKREGVLFRLDEIYYADYHPWIEFGDKSVDEFLSFPDKMQYLEKFFLLDQLRTKIEHKPFLNHIFVSPQTGFSTDEQSVLKLKCGPEYLDFSNFPKGKLRLDFNNTLTKNQFFDFWNSLSPDQITQIEYIEDPCFLDFEDAAKIKEMKIPIAFDRSMQMDFHKYKIYKPNIDLFEAFEGDIIFSSYMGHDLGRYHCYLDLMRNGDLDLVHGIDTPGIFFGQQQLFTSSDMYRSISHSSLDIIYNELYDRPWTKLR